MEAWLQLAMPVKLCKPLHVTIDSFLTFDSDGAAAVLLCSGTKADELGLRKRARVVARTVVGSDPTLMLDGIIPGCVLFLERFLRIWLQLLNKCSRKPGSLWMYMLLNINDN